jgi:hypothetical protein
MRTGSGFWHFCQAFTPGGVDPKPMAPDDRWFAVRRPPGAALPCKISTSYCYLSPF